MLSMGGIMTAGTGSVDQIGPADGMGRNIAKDCGEVISLVDPSCRRVEREGRTGLDFGNEWHP